MANERGMSPLEQTGRSRPWFSSLHSDLPAEAFGGRECKLAIGCERLGLMKPSLQCWRMQEKMVQMTQAVHSICAVLLVQVQITVGHARSHLTHEIPNLSNIQQIINQPIWGQSRKRLQL
jgi:hypothetical protein